MQNELLCRTGVRFFPLPVKLENREVTIVKTRAPGATGGGFEPPVFSKITGERGPSPVAPARVDDCKLPLAKGASLGNEKLFQTAGIPVSPVWE